VGIGTSAPSARLHVVGSIKLVDGSEATGFIPVSDADGVMSWTDPATLSTASIFTNASGVISNENGAYVSDDFVFGSPQLDDDGITAHDQRMFFDKSMAAFRAGTATGTQWDYANVGTYSIATGHNTTASGVSSTATGAATTASGFTSTAMGNGTTASGVRSTAIGVTTIASGDAATSMGYSTTAKSAYETTIGSYNTDYSPSSATNWNAADRLFVIGNGTGGNTKSDAMVVLKNGSTGFGTSTPDNSAKLDVSSTTQGFLPPRMTETQRDAISSPVAGLVVWCTNCGPSGELQVNNGSTWTNMIGGTAAEYVPAIGDYYQGGVIFYLDGIGGGLVCAVSDQSTSAEWGCYNTTLSGADGTVIGTGSQNTIDIVAGCATPDIAADICADLSLNGYIDWFLPSIDELNAMYLNKAAIDATAIINGGVAFGTDWYWSSSEYNNFHAYLQDFTSNSQGVNSKDTPSRMRAVRAF